MTAASPTEPAAERGSVHTLFEEHLDYVWRMLLRFGAPRGELEDLAQEVFLQAHRGLPTFDPRRPVKPWLCGIVFHVVRDAQRERRPFIDRDAVPEDAPRSDPALRQLGAALVLHTALAAVPIERRVVVILHDLEGHTVPEIAELLGLELEAAYARLRTARIELRRAVEALETEGSA